MKTSARARICTVALILAGCRQNDMADIRIRLDALRQHPASNLAPLPAIAPPNPYRIDLKQLRDPFATMANAKTAQSGELSALEGYESSTLKMSGTIAQGQSRWGLILTPDGKLYRVRVGDVLGTHGGIISAIDDQQIEFNENLPDFNGALQEHKSVLMLSGNNKQP
jgi:type IV pilus assembly protein PilP